MSFSFRPLKLVTPVAVGAALVAATMLAPAALAQAKKPNIVMLMTDDGTVTVTHWLWYAGAI